MVNSFEEIKVYDGIAERTGERLDRAGVRGRRSVCRSISDLASKVRRLGDGYYYLASEAWPENTTSLNLIRAWEPLG